jgi:hypothetical protein
MTDLRVILTAKLRPLGSEAIRVGFLFQAKRIHCVLDAGDMNYSEPLSLLVIVFKYTGIWIEFASGVPNYGESKGILSGCKILCLTFGVVASS